MKHHRQIRVYTRRLTLEPCPRLQALRRDCTKYAKRSATLANIARIEQEIKAVEAESQRATDTIDVRIESFFKCCQILWPFETCESLFLRFPSYTAKF